jgi:hypothetical protein
MRSHRIFDLAIAAALLIGSAARAAPCRLTSDDKPVNCPGPAATQPAATGTPPGHPHCVNPKTGKAMRCLPVMLTPTPAGPNLAQ